MALNSRPFAGRASGAIKHSFAGPVARWTGQQFIVGYGGVSVLVHFVSPSVRVAMG
jgi:hypothetical protein